MDNLDHQSLTKKQRRLFRKQQKEKEHLRQIRQKKIKKALTVFAVFLFFAGLVFGIKFIWQKAPSEQIGEKPKIAVFYSPTCSCCHEYLPYLRRNGFQVEENKTEDMLSVKEKYQIPSEMESCHTSVIGDYFVEGHMPVEAIKKLLEEKPEIEGIALAGMPAGSPGMAGFKTGGWKIYGLKNGASSEFLSL